MCFNCGILMTVILEKPLLGLSREILHIYGVNWCEKKAATTTKVAH